ncbi:flagellar hook-associated protein FlgK [Proteocatella sphenisci]|uniref:flagellar hook-associated protein FlgK n=1 Tax=Proteocatella sphenisci TaxID=181070 RepID=UPI00048DFFF9|nr:flagellar hook-associated protein FlgK [Proteocatella sphenisci]
MRSTFAGFTTAQLAMRASQKALDVTGQNIANINTVGYTRQRLDLMSLNTGNGVNKYESSVNVKVGNGVLTTGLSQIRDPFLDIRYRNEAASVGTQDQKLAILKDLETIFDEVTKNGLQNQISEISSMLQKLSSEVGNAEFDSMVKSSSDVLTKMFNQYAKQLDGIREEHETNLNIDVTSINDIIGNIEKLNETIKINHIHGNSALELQDQRNLLIDELSSYMKIDVKYRVEKITDQVSVEVPVISLIGESGKIPLIDGNYKTELKVEKTADGKTNISMTMPDATSQDVTEEVTGGTLKGIIDMLNKSGEFDRGGETVRGIGYYEQSLDLLASKFAESFNTANGPGKELFAASDGTGIITAKNISVSEGWNNGTIGITASVIAGSPVGANDNILNMISMLSEKKDYMIPAKSAVAGPPPLPEEPEKLLFNGSFQEMFTNTGSMLALDVKSTTALLENHLTIADGVANMRDNVSAVSLDEEGMNILHYQNSYNAAARLMTALDEAINTIINGMGIVGR